MRERQLQLRRGRAAHGGIADFVDCGFGGGVVASMNAEMWAALALVAGAFWLLQRIGEAGDFPIMTASEKTIAIAQAIFQAEQSGVMNARNNPGNIRDTSGAIASYATPADGWQHLYSKIDFDFVSARSRIYSPEMTWREVAWMWVAGGAPEMVTPIGNDNPDGWAAIVASQLGVPVDSTVGSYLAS